jgi:hypothetical protein
MGLMSKIGALGAAKRFADKHHEKVEGGIDRAVGVADDRTKGRYRDKLRKGAAAVKGAIGPDEAGGEGTQHGDAGR